MRKCNKHSQYFPSEDPFFPATLEYFHKHSSCKEGLSRWCKRCLKIYNVQRVQKYGRQSHQEYFRTLKGRLRRIYYNLKDRCNSDPTHPSYNNYYGRGIRNLFSSFDTFYNYVINELHITTFEQIDGLDIDRFPNNDGNYEPGNIRFCTHKENLKNRRSKKT